MAKQAKYDQNSTKHGKHNQKATVYDINSLTKKSPPSTKDVRPIPRNVAQEEYVQYLNNESVRLVFGTGPAGTGKTLLATLKAIQLFLEGHVSKIIITRPAVAVDGESHGFLPGDIFAKLEPWTKPILDVFLKFFSHSQIADMIDTDMLEICPLGFMRGRTFDNAVLLLDEAQNSTDVQKKMFLTRIGTGTRAFITGDLEQSDREKGINGLEDFARRANDRAPDSIKFVNFQRKDVERDAIVETVLALYEDE